ncbi:MAG: DnaJ domain-containing protein, partial [Woeseia sp.]
MEFKDYYKVMGVKRDATQDEIKRSYRKLARKYHPDVSKEAGAEERFKEVGEAYAVLKDPEKRTAYDQLGADWKTGQEFRPPPNWDQGFEFHGRGPGAAGGEEFSDFFETLFGRGDFRGSFTRADHRSFTARGEDSFARIAIDLQDSYLGATRSITLQQTELG